MGSITQAKNCALPPIHLHPAAVAALADHNGEQSLAVGILAEWLNLELGIEKGWVTPDRVAAWWESRTESQKRDLRQALAWWIERRAR